MPDPTLPTIVAAIKRQRPEILPPEFSCWRVGLGGSIPDDEPSDWCEDEHQTFIPRPVAIRIVEAALWRERLRQPDPWRSVYLRTDGSVGAHSVSKVEGFGDGPLSLILALCWAMGIELEAT